MQALMEGALKVKALGGGALKVKALGGGAFKVKTRGRGIVVDPLQGSAHMGTTEIFFTLISCCYAAFKVRVGFSSQSQHKGGSRASIARTLW